MMMKKAPVALNVSLALVLLATSLLSGCGERGLGGATKGGETVATINGTVITKGEYDKVFAEMAKQIGADKNPELANHPMFADMLKQNTLNNLLSMAVINQAAKSLNIVVTPEDVKAQTQRIIDQVGGVGKFNELRKKHNLSDKDFTYQMEQIATVEQLLVKKGLAKGAVTPEQVKAFYASHTAEFEKPEEVKSSHILIKAMEAELRNTLQEKNKDIKAEALDALVQKELATRKTKAEDLLKQISANPNLFERLASTQSEDTLSAMNRGDVGFMQERSTDPAYWSAIKAAPVGTLIAHLVKSSYGYHIIKVTEKHAAVKQSLAQATPTIQRRLEQDTKSKAFSAWLDSEMNRLRAAHQIKIEAAYEPKPPEMPAAPKAPVAEKAATPPAQPHKAG